MSNKKRQHRELSEITEIRPAQPNEHASFDHILHELQTHQIELEMQNEELRQAQVALEASRTHYIELYEFAPIGYLTVTAEGVIAETNLFAVKLFNAERTRLINRRIAQYIADEDKERWYRFFRQTMQRNEKKSCELVFLRADGTRFYAQLDCQRTASEQDSPLLRIALNDISERKQADEEQRVAAAAFEAQAGLIVTDADKLMLRVNRAFCQITGYNSEEVIGKETAMLRSDKHHEDLYKNLWDTIAAVGYWQGEIWVKRKNGDVFPAWLTLTAVKGETGNATHYVASLTDITIQKQAEKVLLESRRRLINQVASTKEELVKIKEQTAEVNTALDVMLRRRESDKTAAQVLLSREVETTVLPILDKLKKLCIGQFQTTRLIGILETNLKDVVKSYGRSANLAAVYQKLTPVEKQVASMVRQGQSSKTIAAALNISPGTVSSHRKHIRKKLDLDGKDTNLSNYLASLTDQDIP